MSRSIPMRVLITLAFITLVGVNALANILPLNGQYTGEISDRFQTFFIPAGYVFSIWGLIYLGLGAYAVYQLLPSNQGEVRLGRVDFLFLLSCVLNISWLFLWHYGQFPLTLVAMFSLLATLQLIYTRLEIGTGSTGPSGFWAVNVPFSMYLGWISVATIANTAQLLDFVGWDGWGIAPEMWAVAMLIVAAGLASLMAISRGDIAYVLVFIWAAIGIAVKQSATPFVSITSWSVAGYLVFMVLIAGIQRRRVLDLSTN